MLQAPARGLGAHAHQRRLAGTAAHKLTAGVRGRSPLVPGGLDQKTPGMAVAGLGDRALAAALPGGALA